jgi:hypothetical protein
MKNMRYSQFSNIPGHRNMRFRLLACLLLALPMHGLAQEIEPRRWTHIPTGANFIGGGYGFTEGKLFINQALLIEDAEAEINTIGLSYIRSFGLFGKSARIDIKAPYNIGRWQGLVDGELVSTERSGFADPSIRLSVNLSGAPALAPKEFAAFKPRPIVGAGIRVVLPWAKYEPGRAINLGTNRWMIVPQLGVTRSYGKIQAELTGAVWLFGDNNKSGSAGDALREQAPFYAIQSHLIYNIRRGLWTSLSAGYGTGGKTTVNGVEQDDRQGNFSWAASLGYSINRYQGVKIAFVSGKTVENTGVDFDTISLGYSYMWGEGL